MTTITYKGTLVVETCWCGIRHAIPQELQWEAQRHGKGVHCPLGHSWVYGSTTEKKLAEVEKRLAEERRRAQASRDLLRAEERSHSATKGHLTRQRKRASAGVCPCCNRTFQQLARHMEAKHPGFAA